MIKALGEVAGKPMLVLGLSGENVTRLTAGEPIMFDGTAFGFAGHIVITYGRTEADITRELAEHGLPTPADEQG